MSCVVVYPIVRSSFQGTIRDVEDKVQVYWSTREERDGSPAQNTEECYIFEQRYFRVAKAEQWGPFSGTTITRGYYGDEGEFGASARMG